MTPDGCPKFERCGAPVCPLDADWRFCTHLPGEAVCLLLRESVKPGGDAILRGSVAPEIVEAVLNKAPAIVARYKGIRKTLKSASRTSSRIAAGKALARAA